MKKLLNLTSQNYKPKIFFDVKYSTVLSELKSAKEKQKILLSFPIYSFFSFFLQTKPNCENGKYENEEKN